MRFPQSFLDEIRDRVPISDVIGKRVPWDKRKTNAQRGDYWACCPFHGEKTPSFHCEDKKGRYYCFGCGVSGDHFRFLTELEGTPFPEAVRQIADLAGVPMPERDPEAERREQARSTLSDVMEMAVAYFEAQLQASAGAKARAYLRDRGLSGTTQKKFRLGYAPDSRNGLKEHLASRGAAKDQIEACGLVVFRDDIPVSYDRFRDRIMFPIEDARGRTIAFGGRALSPDVPAKYLNSPETELFHKGNVLYNYRRAREVAREAGTIVAVEGYMDVIALDQAGIANAVAPLGTALTENQLEMLWRLTPEPVLCFDGDKAGVRAAWRSLDLALPGLKPGRSVRYALLPDGKDPDDLVRQGGSHAFTAILAGAKPLADMLWSRETSGKVFDTPERRAELERLLRDAAGTIRDESVRRHYGQAIRERIAAHFGPVSQSRHGGKGGRDAYGPRKGRAGMAGGRLAISESLTRSRLLSAAVDNMPLREAALVSAVLCHPDLLAEHFDDFTGLDLGHGGLERLRGAILDVCATSRPRTREALLEHPALAGQMQTIATLDALIRRARLWTATGEAAFEDAREGFRQALHLHRRARSLKRELRAAEAACASDGDELDYNRLADIQKEIDTANSLEALVDGFGVSSGRPMRSF
ncbi:DNA primase [Oricola cellulosilytica]|uniref:DNA primase n=1 Tax=Oricola cellulosilytica TaxID=1429082 RepID=A0A4R0P2A1_9HYPH|nr:DNA primase [Oricola cellulosilytica]TCD10955.1 DNA primase [Oricola cellulosilytica]